MRRPVDDLMLDRQRKRQMIHTEQPKPVNQSDRHLRFGWWSLLVFLVLGVVLETLHGFKIGWYLDVGNDTRRLMFRLAHAHGTLLAIVNIAAALTLRVKGGELSRTTSASLRWGALLLPLGFLLGGIVIHSGDPGLGIVFVPVGALLLVLGVAGAARTFSSPVSATRESSSRPDTRARGSGR